MFRKNPNSFENFNVYKGKMLQSAKVNLLLKENKQTNLEQACFTWLQCVHRVPGGHRSGQRCEGPTIHHKLWWWGVFYMGGGGRPTFSLLCHIPLTWMLGFCLSRPGDVVDIKLGCLVQVFIQ